MPERPQQPEAARSERDRVIPQSWTEKAEGEDTPDDKGREGPVPEANVPGHHPDREQDQPEGPPPQPGDRDREEPEEGRPEEEPTVEADQADPRAPGPGDSEAETPE
jgi:hypothetical protein